MDPDATRQVARIDPKDPDAVAWEIANEIALIWRRRPEAEWEPFLAAVQRRTTALQRWPAGAPYPHSRLEEAWTVLTWGSIYAAAGGSARLPLWSEAHNPAAVEAMPWLARTPHRNRRRLDGAIKRYERHSAHLPPGWPAGGVAGLLHWVRLEHRQGLM